MWQEQAVFSDYVRLLANGINPDGSSFERLWTALWRAVAKGLRRRGMWELSPRLFGIVGDAYWAERRGTADAGDALDELTADVYTYIFVDRLESLLAQLEVKPQIEGLIHLNVDHFLHERQQSCDPLGTRLYKVLQAAIRDLIANDQLRVVGDGKRPRNSSVLLFGGDEPGRAVAPEVITEAVAGWIDALLPELVTTTGRGCAPLFARLGERIVGLESDGIGAFRFRDLIAPLRADLRNRWAALPGEAVLPIAAEPTPQDAYENRRRFSDLTTCVTRRIRALDRDDADRDLLEALWNALVDGALESDRGDPERPAPAGPLGATMPSKRQLARDLAISRDRLSTLYEMVKRLVHTCRDEEKDPAFEESTMPQEPENGPSASFDNLKQQLRQRSANEAASILETKRRAGPMPEVAPRPGDVYALAEGPDCEWVVLGPVEQAQVLAAPADTLAAIGPGDLAIAAHAPAGPLSVRCHLACALPRTLFSAGVSSRRLDDASLGQVRVLVEIPRETSPADLPDPELEDWLAHLEAGIEPLREQGARRPQRRQRRSQAWLALAAAGAGVALGIGFSGLAITDRPQQPSLEPPVQTLNMRDTPRGGDPVQFPTDAEAIRIALLLPRDRPCDTLALTLLDGDGHVIWQTEDVAAPPGTFELYLRLPRDFLPAGTATLRLESICRQARNLLSEQSFVINVE